MKRHQVRLSGILLLFLLLLGQSNAFAQTANEDWKSNWGFKSSADKYYDSATATEELQARNGAYGSSTTNYNGTVNQTSNFTGTVLSTSSGATNISQESSTSSTIMGEGVTATVVGTTNQQSTGTTQSAGSTIISGASTAH